MIKRKRRLGERNMRNKDCRLWCLVYSVIDRYTGDIVIENANYITYSNNRRAVTRNAYKQIRKWYPADKYLVEIHDVYHD